MDSQRKYGLIDVRLVGFNDNIYIGERFCFTHGKPNKEIEDVQGYSIAVHVLISWMERHLLDVFNTVSQKLMGVGVINSAIKMCANFLGMMRPCHWTYYRMMPQRVVVKRWP